MGRKRKKGTLSQERARECQRLSTMARNEKRIQQQQEQAAFLKSLNGQDPSIITLVNAPPAVSTRQATRRQRQYQQNTNEKEWDDDDDDNEGHDEVDVSNNQQQTHPYLANSTHTSQVPQVADSISSSPPLTNNHDTIKPPVIIQHSDHVKFDSLNIEQPSAYQVNTNFSTVHSNLSTISSYNGAQGCIVDSKEFLKFEQQEQNQHYFSSNFNNNELASSPTIPNLDNVARVYSNHLNADPQSHAFAENDDLYSQYLIAPAADHNFVPFHDQIHSAVPRDDLRMSITSICFNDNQQLTQQITQIDQPCCDNNVQSFDIDDGFNFYNTQQNSFQQQQNDRNVEPITKPHVGTHLDANELTVYGFATHDTSTPHTHFDHSTTQQHNGYHSNIYNESLPNDTFRNNNNSQYSSQFTQHSIECYPPIHPNQNNTNDNNNHFTQCGNQHFKSSNQGIINDSSISYSCNNTYFQTQYIPKHQSQTYNASDITSPQIQPTYPPLPMFPSASFDTMKTPATNQTKYQYPTQENQNVQNNPQYLQYIQHQQLQNTVALRPIAAPIGLRLSTDSTSLLLAQCPTRNAFLKEEKEQKHEHLNVHGNIQNSNFSAGTTNRDNLISPYESNHNSAGRIVTPLQDNLPPYLLSPNIRPTQVSPNPFHSQNNTNELNLQHNGNIPCGTRYDHNHNYNPLVFRNSRQFHDQQDISFYNSMMRDSTNYYQPQNQHNNQYRY